MSCGRYGGAENVRTSYRSLYCVGSRDSCGGREHILRDTKQTIIPDTSFIQLVFTNI